MQSNGGIRRKKSHFIKFMIQLFRVGKVQEALTDRTETAFCVPLDTFYTLSFFVFKFINCCTLENTNGNNAKHYLIPNIRYILAAKYSFVLYVLYLFHQNGKYAQTRQLFCIKRFTKYTFANLPILNIYEM